MWLFERRKQSYFITLRSNSIYEPDFEGFDIPCRSLSKYTFICVKCWSCRRNIWRKKYSIIGKNDDLVLKKIEEFIRDSSNFKKETKKIRSRIKKKFNAKLMSDKFFSILIE